VSPSVRSDPTRSAHGYRRDRLSQFDTGIRYQLWHALALIAVVFVSSFSRPFVRWTGVSRCIPSRRRFSCDPVLTGWLFVVGVVLFSGSLYALAVAGNRRWAAVTRRRVAARLAGAGHCGPHDVTFSLGRHRGTIGTKGGLPITRPLASRVAFTRSRVTRRYSTTWRRRLTNNLYGEPSWLRTQRPEDEPDPTKRSWAP
jgi:uncharacterized membrane protein YgdD (TMEM256/DUF423 family)